MGLTALSVWICTIDFPFRWIGEKFEFAKLLLNSLQFPWRFLAIAVLLCVWVFVMIMANMDFKETEKGDFCCGSLCHVAGKRHGFDERSHE